MLGATISGTANFTAEYGKSGDLIKASEKGAWAFVSGLAPIGGGVKGVAAKAYVGTLVGNKLVDDQSMLDYTSHKSAITAAGLATLTYPIVNFVPGQKANYQQLIFTEFVQQSGLDFLDSLDGLNKTKN